MEQRFFICEHCGNIVAMVKDTGVPVMCCGQKMTEIIPGTTDAAVEKHVPVYQVEGNLVKVQVGAVDHPMLPEHFIEWVSIQTRQGNQRKALKPGGEPKVCFALCEDFVWRPSTPTATCMGSGRRNRAGGPAVL